MKHIMGHSITSAHRKDKNHNLLDKMMRNKSYYVKEMFIIVYLFLYIFAPPFFPISMRVILDAINIAVWGLWTAFHRRIRFRWQSLHIASTFFPFYIYAILNFICFMVFDRNYGRWDYEPIHYASTVLTPLFVLIRLYFLSFFLNLIKRHMGMTMDELMALYFIVGILQLVFVLMAFFFSGFREWSFSLIAANGAETAAHGLMTSGEKRSFGLGDNLYDAFGYAVALLSAISIIRGIHRNSLKYILAFFLMFIIPLLNTRTGIVLNVLALMIATVYLGRKKIAIYLAFVPLMVLAGIGVSEFMELVPEITLRWTEEGIREVWILLTEQRFTGIFKVFYYNHLNFPSDPFFGEGTQPWYFGVNVSDIGYIKGTWLYGLVGLSLVLIAFAVMFYKVFSIAKKRSDVEMQCFILCVSGIFYLYLFKMYSLSNMGAYAVFIPLFIIYLSDNTYPVKNGNL